MLRFSHSVWNCLGSHSTFSRLLFPLRFRYSEVHNTTSDDDHLTSMQLILCLVRKFSRIVWTFFAILLLSIDMFCRPCYVTMLLHASCSPSFKVWSPSAYPLSSSYSQDHCELYDIAAFTIGLSKDISHRLCNLRYCCLQLNQIDIFNSYCYAFLKHGS